MADTENRLALGILTPAALNGSDSYLLENRALASDQPSRDLYPWMVSDESELPRKEVYEITMSGRQKAHGFIRFTWVLFPLTEKMLEDFETDMFGNAEDAVVTVQTLLANGDYATYTAIMLRPVPGEHYQMDGSHIVNYTLRFVGCVLLSSGIYE